MPRTTLLRKRVTPIGTISSHAGGTAPEGHLICDGSIVSIADYPRLYDVIGTSWGYGNNDGLTFHLPDLRGKFLRGVDKDSLGDPTTPAVDPDRDTRTSSAAGGNTGNNVGSVQDDAIRNITGEIYITSGAANLQFLSDSTSVQSSGVMSISRTRSTSSIDNGGVNDTFPGGFDIDASRQVPTGGDNRPINAYVNYIIKAV